MHKIIHFFLTKTKLNYTAFVFLTLLGIISYQNVPKEVFPNIQLDAILVSGSYGGASIDSLNKMAVMPLEKELKSLSGISKIESFIQNDSFSIRLHLDSGLNKYALLDKVKDIITNVKTDLPQDMNEPRAVVVDKDEALLNISISSKTKSHDALVSLADALKGKLSSLENIAKVELNESTARVYELVLNNELIELYGINKESLFTQIKKLSYLFPLGKIEDKNGHLFLSAKNGAKSAKELLETLIKVEDKTLYIKDIASVKRKYKSSDVLSFLNGGKNVALEVFKSEQANAITLSKAVKELVEKENALEQEVAVVVFNDETISISKRLNTVISSILFGLILVSVAIYILINKRVAFVVVLGIPIALLIGVVVLTFTPYTINNITLIGTLLILGVLVDDAVIIAENIQRHISQGEDALTSALLGTKEVLAPVLASSLTTVFAFLPMFMISGALGELLKMIPIAVVVLIVASLIECFVFLPIHALHVFKKDDKELSWQKLNLLYAKVLCFILRFKKSFIFGFAISITLLTFLLASNMRFQLFQDFDEERFFISGKFTPNHTLEEVHTKTKAIEQKLLELKDTLGLKSIAYTVGARTDNQENSELKSSVFEFDIEVQERVPQNFVDGYITPLLSFNSYEKGSREKSIQEIILLLNKTFKDFKPEGLVEFAIKNEGAGITHNDIEIFLSHENEALLLEGIKQTRLALQNMKGIIFVDDTAKKGAKELKLSINAYGQSLGFTEASVSEVLFATYLEASQTKGLDSKGLIEFITFSHNKDSFEAFERFELVVPNTEQQVALKEIADFTYTTNFDSLYKLAGVGLKAVVANVNAKTLTPTEALSKLEDTLNALEKKGIRVILEGEESKKRQVAKELLFAFFIALFLIFLTLLVLFDHFGQVLIVLVLIPFSVTGAIFGHLFLGLNLSLPSFIGLLGLAGVVINDAIVMLDFIKKTTTVTELIQRASYRLRPIIITSVTTFLGLSTLIFFATGQSRLLQPIAISLGFGLLWGTVLTLLFLPTLFALVNKNITTD